MNHLTQSRQTFFTAIRVLFFMTIMIGVVYPLLMTLLTHIFFSAAANGSLIQEDGQIIGSRLIGQQFLSDDYFWGRPSATSDFSYNPLASGGSQLAPSNPDLLKVVRARVQALHQANPRSKGLIPIDLVTSSGSGLDPEISIAAARYQIPRIAHARHLPDSVVLELVNAHIIPRQWGFLGEERVNVLELNRLLDQLVYRVT